MRKLVFIILALPVLAALLRYWIAPLAKLLPAYYANEAKLVE